MKKKKIFGASLKDQLRASVNDRLSNFLLEQGKIRGVVLNGTRMINEMRWNHELGMLETLALGHAYLGAALMSCSLKGSDRLSLQVECSGPIKGLAVEANAFGEVRGYLNRVPIPVEHPLESFNLSPFFGAGFLSVTRYLENAKQPFTGKVMMEYGSLAKDLAVYFLKSEQIPSAFILSVFFDAQGEVKGAGGVFLQAMPGADDEMLADLEQRLRHLPSLGQVVNQEGFPQQWLQEHFGPFGPRLLSQRGIEFMCHCNRRQIRAMIAMLEIDTLQDMATNGPFPLQVRCHHCNTRYDFSRVQIEAIHRQRLAER